MVEVRWLHDAGRDLTRQVWVLVDEAACMPYARFKFWWLECLDFRPAGDVEEKLQQGRDGRSSYPRSQLFEELLHQILPLHQGMPQGMPLGSGNFTAKLRQIGLQ